ncbi:MAG TPA: hypothetical protein VEL11_08405 [Candidatus Bathyarchaeia archaeon]|nr:hypothetical protein [Candidatus Bathyarchaeia archaeon]
MDLDKLGKEWHYGMSVARQRQQYINGSSGCGNTDIKAKEFNLKDLDDKLNYVVRPDILPELKHLGGLSDNLSKFGVCL